MHDEAIRGSTSEMSKSLWKALHREEKTKEQKREAGRKPCGNGDAGVTVYSETARVVVMSKPCIH